MTKRILFLLLKTLLISLVLFSAYYFLFLKPKKEMSNNLSKVQNILSTHKNNLIQNKLAFVQLTKLNPESPSFDLEKSSIIGTLKKTNEDGLKLTETEKTLPKVNDKLNKRFPSLMGDTKKVYESQKTLLDKVFATKSYEEGVEILKSVEAVKLLTQQTNLVLEYKFWLKIVANSK